MEWWRLGEYDAITTLTALLVLSALLQTLFLWLSYNVYRLMMRPVVFAWLRDGKDAPGIHVENAGKGTAWHGVVKVRALPSKMETLYDFTRLYPTQINTHPTGEQTKLQFDPKRDTYILVKISYQNLARGKRWLVLAYRWKAKFPLQREWRQEATRATLGLQPPQEAPSPGQSLSGRQ